MEDGIAGLDEHSNDLGGIAEAVLEDDSLPDCGIGDGFDSQLVIVQDLVVDPYWRGSGLGPAFAIAASRYLGGHATFLAAFALPTRRGPDGVWRSNYEGRRPPAEAQRKVENSYRVAGFRTLNEHVMWALNADLASRYGPPHAQLAIVEQVACEPKARAWYLRRARRRAAHQLRAGA